MATSTTSPSRIRWCDEYRGRTSSVAHQAHGHRQGGPVDDSLPEWMSLAAVRVDLRTIVRTVTQRYLPQIAGLPSGDELDTLVKRQAFIAISRRSAIPISRTPTRAERRAAVAGRVAVALAFPSRTAGRDHRPPQPDERNTPWQTMSSTGGRERKHVGGPRWSYGARNVESWPRPRRAGRSRASSPNSRPCAPNYDGGKVRPAAGGAGGRSLAAAPRRWCASHE
jgi:hypothetical protein